MRVADYIAKFLKSKKVDSIFMLTGYGAMYMNDAIKVNNISHIYGSKKNLAENWPKKWVIKKNDTIRVKIKKLIFFQLKNKI